MSDLRELDAAIAVEVFGWTDISTEVYADGPALVGDPPSDYDSIVPGFSSLPTACAEVKAWIVAKGWNWLARTMNGGRVLGKVWTDDRSKDFGKCANTEEEAVCRAVLAAVRATT